VASLILRLSIYNSILVFSFALIYPCSEAAAQQIASQLSRQTFRYTIQPNARDEVVLRVIPNATCKVRGHKSAWVPFFSESGGYSHFFFTAPNERLIPVVLQVTCTRTTGNAAYTVELYPNTTPAPGRPESPKARPTEHRII